MSTIKSTINVEITLYPQYENVESSSITDVTNPDGTINQYALDDYLYFIEEVKDKFDEHNMVILNEEDKQKSHLSETSHYFDIYKSTSKSEVLIKFIAFLRISDHKLPEHFVKLHKDDPKKKSEVYKQPKSKKKQKFKPYDIIVNKTEFDSYEDALKRIEEILQEVERKSR